MIRAFAPAPDTGLRAVDNWRAQDLEHPVIWFDLVAPSEDEVDAVCAHLGLSIPGRNDLRRAETTSRLYASDSGLVMTFRTLPEDMDETESHGVMCLLQPDRLVTIRSDLNLRFDIEESRAIHPKDHPVNPSDVFAGLLDAQVDRITERLQALGHHIDTLLEDVFFADTKARRSANVLRDVIHTLGRLGSQTAKVQDCLISLERLAVFLAHHQTVASKRSHYRTMVSNLSGEVRSLGEYARALDGKVDMLLNASLGFVGIDQNQVMKTVTIVAALFLPGTLISSIFGMNFEDMPAIHWHYGFIAATLGSLCTALGLAAVFRRLRWM